MGELHALHIIRMVAETLALGVRAEELQPPESDKIFLGNR